VSAGHRCLNFRDIGGVAGEHGVVVRGRLFRTAHLSGIDDDSAEHLTRTLGISRYIDFRGDDEVQRDGGAPHPLVERGVKWIRHPFDIADPVFLAVRRPDAAEWEALYVRALRRLQERFAGAIRLIAETNTPVVYGCWVGKDRTGMVTALLLSLLGVDDRTIAEDFARSTSSLAVARARFTFLQSYDPEEADAVFRSFTVAAPQSMLGFLRAIRQEFGSIREAIGVDQVTADTLLRHYVHDR
jgi:protein-tyrosine phosphatase